ncbi:MAG: hypothetical protein GXO79_03685 [Chlorobi bacterium]|nr:hypothetical protein [Chlorobiota bacterium]
MKRTFFILINVILFGFINNFYAQSTLWLMNGKKLTIDNFEIVENEGETLIKYYNTHGKYKKIEMIDVFSVTDTIGDETVFHSNDTINGIAMNKIQLRSFLQGEQEAILNYSDYFSFISSYPIGFVSVFYPPFSKIFLFPVYPSAYVSVIGLSSPEYEQIVNEYPKQIDNPYFVMGYKEAVRKKRIKNSLLGAGAGLLSGIVVAILIGY